tara:strand:+ start:615 stop:839 length:225 start_codon:yes stop_codon:yes gene_type:complete
VGEAVIDGCGFCSFRGGDDVSRNDDPAPRDIRLADELERLCAWLTVLEFVDFDQRLRLPPWISADVTGLELRAF